METSTRAELVDWILQLKDEELLSTLKLLKDASEEGDWFDTLTAKEVESIQRGMDDQNRGRTLTSEQFWKRHGR